MLCSHPTWVPWRLTLNDTHLGVVEPVKEFKKSLCPLLIVWGFFEARSSRVTQGSIGTLFVTLNDLKLYSLQPPFAKG